MPFRELRGVVPALLVALLLPLLVAADELDTVVEQRKRVAAELDGAVDAYEQAVGRLADAERELATLAGRTQELEQEAAEVGEHIATRARMAFRSGDGSFLASILSADGLDGAIERAELLNALTVGEQGRLEAARTLRIRLEQNRELLADRRAELAELRDQLAARSHDLTHRLENVKARERDIRTRRERQRRIERGVQEGVYACIMQRPYHFRDTWGAPRGGGIRRHQGTDVMGLWRAEVYAFTNGRISRISRSGLGGLGVYLWGDDGNEYYYAHLDGIASGVRAGMRVEAGQLLAYNGASGNAGRSAPHVHFELHPGGGRAVNPYMWMAAACF